MSMVINEKGIIFLAKTILGLADTVGLQKARRIVESTPEVFMELLGDNHVLTKSGFSKNSVSSSFGWDENNAEVNIKKLKLTNYQNLILKTIANNNNSATLTELEEEFQNQGIEVKNGSMIGGSLAGITKKCESYNIPVIYTVDHSNSTTKYQIVPEAKDLIPKFLN